MNKTPVIALLGQPNSGKSTIFNMMTGSHQHVGNWPGKTVDQKEGEFRYNGKQMILADLPGSYSLSAGSDEEIITKDYISSGNAESSILYRFGKAIEPVTLFFSLKWQAFLAFCTSAISKESLLGVLNTLYGTGTCLYLCNQF